MIPESLLAYLDPVSTGMFSKSELEEAFCRDVHHLSLHFPTNFGEDIGLAGKCTEANRVVKINAVYEARAVLEDHAMADK